MDRYGKGSAVRNYVDSYCVVDLETTGVYVSSAQIIEIAAIRVRSNEVVEIFNTLVNPQCCIPADATAVNNISDEMVKEKPILDEVLDSFISFLGSDVIVGHNNAGFDMNLIYDSLMKLRGKTFGNNYIDILYAARKCLPVLSNHKLETISKYYNLDTRDEHRALKDCLLTKSCYEKLYEEFGDNMFSKKASGGYGGNHSVHYSTETKALQELQLLLENIIEDQQVTLEEFSILKMWMEDHRDLQGNYPFDRVFNALDKVLEDGIVSSEELDELQELFSDFVDPVKRRGCHDDIKSIYDKHIVVTGDFDYGSRKDVCDLIESAGGIIDKGVKKTTNYVVVGAKGSDNWKTGKYGGKIQKALELKDKGADIEIVEEKGFISAMQSIIKNGKRGEGRDFLATGMQEFADEIDCMENSGKTIDWKKDILEMLENLIREYELPNNSLYMSDKKSQSIESNSDVISHSVCIWEPDYPTSPHEVRSQNKLVLNIALRKVKSRPDDLELSIREAQVADLQEHLPKDAEVLNQTKTGRNTGMVKIRINRTSPNLTEYIRQNTIYCLERYESKATKFGCCSLFEKCSDAKTCLHVNKLYSKACMYRKNLEQGHIFYGKNRNNI